MQLRQIRVFSTHFRLVDDNHHERTAAGACAPAAETDQTYFELTVDDHHFARVHREFCFNTLARFFKAEAEVR